LIMPAIGSGKSWASIVPIICRATWKGLVAGRGGTCLALAGGLVIWCFGVLVFWWFGDLVFW
jgi:hypothetical protein